MRSGAGRSAEDQTPARSCPRRRWSKTTTDVGRYVECGAELLAERAELGYTYCTKDVRRARHHRGLVVTGVGMNKSGVTVVVRDAAEIRTRGDAGE